MESKHDTSVYICNECSLWHDSLIWCQLCFTSHCSKACFERHLEDFPGCKPVPEIESVRDFWDSIEGKGNQIVP